MPPAKGTDGLMPSAPNAGSVACWRSALTGVVAMGTALRPGNPAHAAHLVPSSRSISRNAVRALIIAVGVVPLAACGVVSGWFGDDTPKPQAVPVLKVSIGQCFATPPQESELTDLESLPCDVSHRQEAYALLDYQQPAGVQGDAYPGDALLTNYANAACAEAFEPYVGVSYLNSSLYFTFLIPSARGWQESGDRTVTCFITRFENIMFSARDPAPNRILIGQP